MKVKELIQELQKFDTEMDVWIQDFGKDYMTAESVNQIEIWQEDWANIEGGYYKNCVLISYE